MRVILEAFGGVLKSDVMNWPEGQGPEIRMVLDSPGMRAFALPDPAAPPSLGRLATFEYVGRRTEVEGLESCGELAFSTRENLLDLIHRSIDRELDDLLEVPE